MRVTAQDQLADSLAGAKRRIADLEAINERLRENILALFKRSGADTSQCRYCEMPVYWMTHRDTGKHGIYDPDGASHWSTCKNVLQARRDADAKREV